MSSLQIFLRKDNNSGSLVEGTLLAVGGRYDHLIYNLWNKINVGYPFMFLDVFRIKYKHGMY